MKLSQHFSLGVMSLLMAANAWGQTNTLEAVQTSEINEVRVAPSQINYKTPPIYTQDFASGIPAGWTNQIFNGNSVLYTNASAKWEYRGPNTTPDNTHGSRGAYSGVSTGLNSPINSSSLSNGFVIFDSDFLDNGGLANNMGGGVAPSPHVGILTSDSINLTGHSQVYMEFQYYSKVFFANLIVEFSNDGGTTWANADTVDGNGTLGVNGSTVNAKKVRLNVSSYIGNSSNAMFRFVFDGTPGNTSGNGYYFWMIDDIVIDDLPEHDLRFTMRNQFTDLDIQYYNGTSSAFQSKYGNLFTNESRPISFSASIINLGYTAQTSVQLKVRILNSTGGIVQTLSSPPIPSVATNQTIGHMNLTTTTWTPTVTDDYTFVYYIESDSLNGLASPFSRDTLLMSLSANTTSLGFEDRTSSIGTSTIGHDGSKLAIRLEFFNDEYLDEVKAFLAPSTVAGGIVEFTLYDSTGFSFTSGFPTTPMIYRQHTITATDLQNGYITFDLRDANQQGVLCSTASTNAYYGVLTMFSSAGSYPISFWNDQRIVQPLMSSIMYYTLSSPRWYTGFMNSLTLNSPIVHFTTSPGCNSVTNLGTLSQSCPPYTAPSGAIFNTAGTGYSDTVLNTTTNCTSIYLFDLEFNNSSELSGEICPGDSVPYFDTIVTAAGVYSHTIVGGATGGCDSIVNLTVTYEQLNTGVTIIGNGGSLRADDGLLNYQWIKCDLPNPGPIAGATQRVYNAQVNGSYAVIVSKGNCSDTSSCYTISNVSTPEWNSTEFMVYPNPAQNIIQISLINWSDIERLDILSMDGRILHSEMSPREDHPIDLVSFSNGMYFIRLTKSDGSTLIEKLNVQN